MKTRTFLLLSIAVSIALSLVVTLATYFCVFVEPLIIDASNYHRGWPFYWMTESWSSWGLPPYFRRVSYQPVNFLLDTLFFAIVFQMLIHLCLYLSKGRQKPSMTESSSTTT